MRWCGDESLEIYARLNDEEWTHVSSTYSAHVDSTVASRLRALGPALDFEQLAPRLATGAEA